MIRGLRARIARAIHPAPARRALEAAGGGRRWREDPAVRDGAQTVHSGAYTVAARAAYYAMNNPHGARIVESLSANLVGTGIVPRPRHPAEAMRERLSRDFLMWTDDADAEGRTDLYGLQSLFVRDVVTFGEALAVWTSDPNTAAPQLRRLHPEQLDRSRTVQLPTGGTIVQGVEFSAAGRIVAYWLRPRAPGDALAGLPLTSVRHPAGEVLHVFRPLFPGQVRGLSWFAPVLLSAHELAQLTDAMLVRAKVAALFAGFVTTVADDAHPLEDDDGFLPGTVTGGVLETNPLEPGAFVEMAPGESVDFASPPDPGNVPEFAAATLRTIATGAGVTYEQLTGDYRNTNYSSARAALLEFRRFCEGVQHHTLVHQMCRPVWTRFLGWEVLSGAVPATAYQRDRAAYLSVKWLPPAWQWVDPLKDGQAAVLELNSNLRSRTEIVAERGYDVEQLDREIAADRERERRLGIEPRDTAPTATVAPSEDERRSALPHVTFRAAPRPASVDEAARTAELIASTGAGVVRLDVDGPFTEVLQVTPNAVDLTRTEHMPLLDSHRQDGLDRVLGVVRAVRFERGALVVTVEFSPRAEAVWQDVRAGIIRNVSVGYQPVDWRDETDAAGRRVRRVTRWQLHEISLVAVGADPAAQVRDLTP